MGREEVGGWVGGCRSTNECGNDSVGHAEKGVGMIQKKGKMDEWMQTNEYRTTQ